MATTDGSRRGPMADATRSVVNLVSLAPGSRFVQPRGLPIVLELERYWFVEFAQALDHALQIVLALCGYADCVALDGRFDFRKLVTDELAEPLRQFVRQPSAQRDDLSNLVAAGRFDLPPVEDLQRQIAFDGFRLDEFPNRFRPEFVVGDERDVVLALGEVHARALEVE